MSLIGVVITILVIGVLLWLFETYIPLTTPIRRILQAVVVIALVVWLLQISGVLSTVNSVPFPHR